jgi:PAS domain S-box-containing protein
VTTKKGASQADDAWRLQLLIDSVIDYAIYMIDLDGRVLTWNTGAARLKGYTADEIIGQLFSKFFTPEDQAREFPRSKRWQRLRRPAASKRRAGEFVLTVLASGPWLYLMPFAIMTENSWVLPRSLAT